MGVRRYQNKDGTLTSEGRKRYSDELNVIAETKSGQKLLISQDKSLRLAQFIAKHNKRVRDELNCTITDLKGNRVGELELYKESSTSLNVVWVGINDKYQGNGYGQAVMKAEIKYAKQTGLKQVTLEVPQMLDIFMRSMVLLLAKRLAAMTTYGVV